MKTACRSLLCAIRLAGGLALAIASTSGCHRPMPSQAVSSAAANGELVLVMLSEARAWQRRADLHLSDGDIGAAIAATKEVLKIPFPSDTAEAEEVRLDACARLAKLYLGPGPSAEEGETQALGQIDAGRRIATHDSFFRAQLETVAADVYEARANRLADDAARKAEKRKAVEALERAIEIDRHVQRALLNLPEGSGHDGDVSWPSLGEVR